MAPVNLQRLLQKEKNIHPLIDGLLAAVHEPISILDVEGRLLLGTRTDNLLGLEVSHQITHQGHPVGRVVGSTGSQWAAWIADMMTFLMEDEEEKRALATEVLDKYRELHLLYRLSEKLAASPQVENIARLAVLEACQLIKAAGGFVIFKHEGSSELEMITSCGDAYELKPDIPTSDNIIGRALQKGGVELSNHLVAVDYFKNSLEQDIALICAPLKTEQRILGAIALVDHPPKQFTAGDLKLLNAIAMQTAPAIEIARLHQTELVKARLERDLQVAHQVQSGLLPRQMPVLDGWKLAALWEPARAVSGDFYDFIYFPDGKLGIIVADVSDKGVPAALVMANTRTILRTVALSTPRDEIFSSGRLLARVNDIACDDIPLNMFVTCLLAILDPSDGRICFANAGHNLPIQRTSKGVFDHHVTGLPLGVFPGTVYDEKETILAPGESILMFSDGITEAHNQAGEMFDKQRLFQYLEYGATAPTLQGENLIRFLMNRLAEFTGPNWEQEDDVTLVTLEHSPIP